MRMIVTHNIIKLAERRFVCHACGENPDSHIILIDELWDLVSDYKRELLCLPCIEKNLGRKVYVEDLKDAPINFTIKLLLNRINELENE